MRYQSTGEVRPTKPGDIMLSGLPGIQEKRFLARTVSGCVTPRVIMEAIPDRDQLRDRAIEALVRWRKSDDFNTPFADWLSSLSALRRAAKDLIDEQAPDEILRPVWIAAGEEDMRGEAVAKL